MIAKARGARRILRLRGYGLARFARRGSRQVTVRKQIPSPWSPVVSLAAAAHRPGDPVTADRVEAVRPADSRP
jgi:hypothetical protein